MTDIYDVYGGDCDLKSAIARVAAALEVKLVLHSSEHLGGDYYRTPFPDDTIEVVNNGPFSEPDDVPYDEFSDYQVIIEVNESPRCDEYREKLVAAGFKHLERESIRRNDDA